MFIFNRFVTVLSVLEQFCLLRNSGPRTFALGRDGKQDQKWLAYMIERCLLSYDDGRIGSDPTPVHPSAPHKRFNEYRQAQTRYSSAQNAPVTWWDAVRIPEQFFVLHNGFCRVKSCSATAISWCGTILLLRNGIYCSGTVFCFWQANDRLVHMQALVNKHFARWYEDVLLLENDEDTLGDIAQLREDINKKIMGDLPKNAKTSEKKDAEMAVQMYVDEAITGKGRDRCVLVLFFNRVMPVVVIG